MVGDDKNLDEGGMGVEDHIIAIDATKINVLKKIISRYR